MKAFFRSTVIKPPSKLPGKERKSVFLAGSIDMGKAENWQERAQKIMRNSDLNILNPRREKWDPTLKQSIDNVTFRQQVEWELDAMDQADAIIMYFDPSGKAPITLLELGLHAKSGKLFICCQDGYWRKGNVEIIANRYEISMYENLDECVRAVLNFLSLEKN